MNVKHNDKFEELTQKNLDSYSDKFKADINNSHYKKAIIGCCYKLYGQKIYYYFISQVATRDLARELRQIVFLKLCEYDNAKFAQVEDYLAFIIKISENVLIDHFREFSQHSKAIKKIKQELTVNPISQNQRESSHYDHIDILTRLKPYLTTKQFKVLKLRYENYSHDEIARLLKLRNKSSSEMLFYRAKQRLQNIGYESIFPESTIL